MGIAEAARVFWYGEVRCQTHGMLSIVPVPIAMAVVVRRLFYQ